MGYDVHSMLRRARWESYLKDQTLEILSGFR